MTSDSLFSGIRQEEVRYRDFVARSPLFYRRASVFAGIFLADLAEARALMPTPLHHPLVAIPGRTVVALHCFEYADTDIGPYNEVSLSIAIRHGSAPRLGPGELLLAGLSRTYHGFVATLPVTTEAALYGGLDLFNYPKVLADITFADDARSRTCTLRARESGAPIMTARVRKLSTGCPAGRLLAGRTLTFVSYPRKGDTTLRAELRVRLLERGASFGSGHLALDLGADPASDVFRRLRLSAPVHVLYAPRCEAILALPTPCGSSR